jgi:hypothetical protein
MPKKSSDPFMGGLWNALIADKLGPAGLETGWDETPARTRNRFIQAVRQILQSGAAFEASMIELGMPGKTGVNTEAKPAEKSAARPSRKARGKQHDPRELQLPLMASVQPHEKPAGKRER